MLVGNSVGKSTLSQLTGVSVSSNYPGATVGSPAAVRHDGFARNSSICPASTRSTPTAPRTGRAPVLADGRPTSSSTVTHRLERNLYLTLELLELGLPVVVALHMNEDATRRGMSIDIERLAVLLGVPVVVSARWDRARGAVARAGRTAGGEPAGGLPRCVEARCEGETSACRGRAMTPASGAAGQTPEVLAAIAAARTEGRGPRGARLPNWQRQPYGDAGLIAQR